MRGSLETVSVAELCVQLGSQGFSGTLSLQAEEHYGQIAFQDGAIVWGTSPSRGARIGERLVHAGLLDPYYVDQAAQAQRDAPQGTGIAALLVDRGLISADAARVFLQEQMIDSLTDVLGWQHGSFEVSNDPPPVVRLPVMVSTEVLLTEVRRRLAEQQRIRGVVASLEMVPTATGNRPEPLALDESVVLAEVDGRRTVRDLAKQLGFGENEARRIVYGLTLLGAVSLNGATIEADDDPLDDVEHAIEERLDEVLAHPVGQHTNDDLDSVLAGLLSSDAGVATGTAGAIDAEPEAAPAVADEQPAAAEDPVAPAEVAMPEEPSTREPEPAPAPAFESSQIEAKRFEDSEIDEPRPWVGYANAKPGTTPPSRPRPGVPSRPDDLPYVVSVGETSEAAEAEPATLPDEEPPQEEAVSWLADVGGVPASAPVEDAPAEEAATPAADEPAAATQAAPNEQPAAPEQAPSDADTMWTDEPAAPATPRSTRSGGDDLSALLAELSSLSVDEDPGDRQGAPPPRKPSTPPPDDGKDPKKRRLFGR